MTIETRLKLMKEYRLEALADPDTNKLYIEDLELSIAMFEKAVKNKRYNKTIIEKGFDLSEESV